MTKKYLVKIIREVVKLEIKSAVKREINEVLNDMEQSAPKNKRKVKLSESKNYTSNSSLNKILNETANSEEFNDWPEMDPNSLRQQFAATQGTSQQTDINNRPVDTSKLDPSVGKALTRDYSELVKRFK